MAVHGALHRLHHRHRPAHRPGTRRHRGTNEPYAALWDPTYKNKTAIIDEFHTAMSMVLLKMGITDVNTPSADDPKKFGDQLTALVEATSPKVTTAMWSELPAGRIGLFQMWSGDTIAAVRELPQATGPEILRYWFPVNGRGLVDHDLIVLLRSGKNPVLGHLFLNHMLEAEVAKHNFKEVGWQPPRCRSTRISWCPPVWSRRTC